MLERTVHRMRDTCGDTCDYLSYANSASAAQRSTQEHPGKRLDLKRSTPRLPDFLPHLHFVQLQDCSCSHQPQLRSAPSGELDVQILTILDVLKV